MRTIIISLPLIILLTICFFVLIYLIQGNDPSKPPSVLINKAIPNFESKNLFDENDILSNKYLKNKYVLINFFASWCAPCKKEHPLFFKIKKDFPKTYLLGINHKDKINDAQNYLNNYGNPYTFVGIDKEGQIALEFGVFGLPETFIINNNGKIIFKHIGPLTKKIINNEIKPLLQKN